MISKNKKIVIQNQIRRTALIVTAVLLAASCYGIIKSLSEKTEKQENVLYKSLLKADSSYEVTLVENELYPDGVLEEGRFYARALADHLNVVFSAEFLGDKKADISGNYSIAVIVEGYQSSENSRKIIYEKRYPFVEDKKIEGSSSVTITDEVSLNLQEYKAFADKADQILNAKPNREARIEFTGIIYAETEFGDVEEPFTYCLYFPLSSELFTVTKDAAISKNNVISEMSEKKMGSSPQFAGFYTFACFAMMIAAAVLIFFCRPPTESEAYVLGFKAILRKYGSRMVKLKGLPPIPNDSFVLIADIDSLIKVSDERQQPVCYYPDEQGMPLDGLLYVPDHDKYYKLYLK